MQVSRLDEKLAEMRSRYLARIRGDRVRLEVLCDELENGEGFDMAEEIERLAHRLAGSSGTFGLPEIGQHAEMVERMAHALIHGEGDRADLAAGTRALSQAIEAAE